MVAAHDTDLLHPSQEREARKHKLKRLVASADSYFLDVKCPSSGCPTMPLLDAHVAEQYSVSQLAGRRGLQKAVLTGTRAAESSIGGGIVHAISSAAALQTAIWLLVPMPGAFPAGCIFPGKTYPAEETHTNNQQASLNANEGPAAVAAAVGLENKDSRNRDSAGAEAVAAATPGA